MFCQNLYSLAVHRVNHTVCKYNDDNNNKKSFKRSEDPMKKMHTVSKESTCITKCVKKENL